MTLMNGGQALVAALRAHGVDTVFGIPGTHNLPIYAALAGSGVRHVLTRHEQGAGYAADGYARVGGRPGVCVTTTGPAILNAAAAAAQAYSDSSPVLLVSPGMPLRHPGRGTGLLHEVKDQRAALNAIVEVSHRVGAVEEIPLAVAQCFATMTGGRPRPVHLDIPLDLLDEVTDVTVVEPVAVSRRTPAASALAAAAAALAAAARPAIIAGGGARGAAEQVRLLAERLGAPVACTANGKGTLPDAHRLAVGAGLHHAAVADLAADSDVLLVVGSELSPADLWNGPLPRPRTVVRIDIDPVAALTNLQPDVSLIGDSAATIGLLLEALGAAPGVASGDAGQERAASFRQRFREQARSEGAPWLEIVDAVSGALGPDGILAGDSTMACYYGALSNLPAHAPSRFLYPTGLGTLGFGLPAAIGAKLARPDAPVLALHGDGGVMFTIAEFATAVALGLNLPVVVVDNGGYGEIRNEMADRGDPVHAVALGHPDFAALAVALGGHGVRAEDPGRLAAAVVAAFRADRPTLIHVREPVWR